MSLLFNPLFKFVIALFFISTSSHFQIINSRASLLFQKTKTQVLAGFAVYPRALHTDDALS